MRTNRPRKAGEIPSGEPRLSVILFFAGVPCALYFVVLWLLGADSDSPPGGLLGGVAIALGVGAIWGTLVRLWVAAFRRMRSSRADH